MTIRSMKEVRTRAERRHKTESDAAKIGRRLRERRLMAGMSLEAACARIGVSFQQLAKFESGSSLVAAAYLGPLAIAYGCKISDFISDAADKNSAKPLSTIAVASAYHMSGLPDHIQGIVAELIVKLGKAVRSTGGGQ